MYWWEALPSEFTSSTIANFERVRFLTENKNRRIHEVTSARVSKSSTIRENGSPKNVNEFHSILFLGCLMSIIHILQLNTDVRITFDVI